MISLFYYFVIAVFMFIYNPCTSENTSITTWEINKKENSNSINNPAEKESNNIQLRVFNINGISEKFKNLILSGILSTYENSPNLGEAFAAFDSLIQMRPDRPEGYFLKTALFLSLYQIDNSTANFDSLKTYVDKTLAITENQLKYYPNDQYLLFYLGVIYGNIGLQNLRQKSYWNAYWNGKKGKDYLEKAIKVDPTLADAELGLGIFLYFADIMPKYIKPLMFIVGLSGDREKGLKKIRFAVENSALSKVEAYYFLATILNKYEGNIEEAQKIYKMLHSEFPKNLYYHYSMAVSSYENGNYLEAKKIFEEMNATWNRYYSRSVTYYLGCILHAVGDYYNSTIYLKSLAFSYSERFKDRQCETFYLIGLNYEYQNDRENALVYYNYAKENGSKLYSEEIKNLLKTPLNSDDKIVKRVDTLINSEAYSEAEKILREKLNQIKNSNISNTQYSAMYNLQLAEVLFRQNRFGEFRTFFQDYTEKQYKENDIFLARYHILGVVTNIGMNNDTAEEHIKKLKKIDLEKLPVYYQRKFNELQFRLFGEVKYR
ncbi:hypothetical protein AMJ80_11345 [bacterium SM23_31]|nr:MAG: hypothetical protein AMJ80_11345 [bacterium SM23_31]